MDDYIAQAQRTFFDEAVELLEESEDILLRLEEDAHDNEAIHALFRAVHTIKGSAGSVELPELAEFTHEVEALLQPVRAGEISITSEMIDVLLQAKDIISELLEQAQTGVHSEPQGMGVVINTLHQLSGHMTEAVPPPRQSKNGRPVAADSLPPEMVLAKQYDVHFHLDSGAFYQGLDPLTFLRSLSDLGAMLNVHSDLSRLPSLQELDPEACYLGFAVHLETDAGQDRIEDVFEFVDGNGSVSIAPAPDGVSAAADAAPAALSEDADFDAALLVTFLEEATEQLDTVEALLLQIDGGDRSPETIQETFRHIHTLKGNADYMGLRELTHLAHGLERLLKGVSEGDMALRDTVIALFFDGLDLLKAWVNAAGHPAAAPPPTAPLLQRIKALAATEVQAGAPATPPAQAQDGAWTIFHEAAVQYFDAIQHALQTLADTDVGAASVNGDGGMNGDGDLDSSVVLERALHSLSSSAGFVGHTEMVAATECLLQKVAQIRESPASAAAALAEDLPALQKLLERGKFPPPGGDLLGKILAEQGKVSPTDGGQALTQQKPLGKQLVEEGKASPQDVDKASDVQRRRRDTGKSAAPSADARSLRVDQRKVDKLMNLIGELIVAKNTLAHQVLLVEQGANGNGTLRKLRETSALMNRISTDLQDGVMALRMVPVRTVFRRFPRLVRDIARRSDKQIDLHLLGEDTALDKTVIESLADPLVHMIRNSCDHGIETPAARRAAGKPENGQVILQARQQGNSVFIEVMDDGKGINADKVLAKAVEKGVVTQSQAAHMSQQEKIDLVFTPGFSTVDQVSELSGRGVGMDVVATSIRKLGGEVSIHSGVGEGTKVEIQLPLTLAAQDVLLVEDRGQTFAFPMDMIVETVKVMPQEIRPMHGRQVIAWRGEVLGIAWLSDLLSLQCPDTDAQPRGDDLGQISVLLVSALGVRMGIAVDRLQYQQEAVVKPLPSILSGLPGLAAATVMGDGSVVLIVDPVALLRKAMGTGDEVVSAGKWRQA